MAVDSGGLCALEGDVLACAQGRTLSFWNLQHKAIIRQVSQLDVCSSFIQQCFITKARKREIYEV